MWDKIWLWKGWLIIKWPFGIIILCFVLFLIWNMETRKDYPQQVISAVKEIRLPDIKFNNIKLFDSDRAIK